MLDLNHDGGNAPSFRSFSPPKRGLEIRQCGVLAKWHVCAIGGNGRTSEFKPEANIGSLCPDNAVSR